MVIFLDGAETQDHKKVAAAMRRAADQLEKEGAPPQLPMDVRSKDGGHKIGWMRFQWVKPSGS